LRHDGEAADIAFVGCVRRLWVGAHQRRFRREERFASNTPGTRVFMMQWVSVTMCRCGDKMEKATNEQKRFDHWFREFQQHFGQALKRSNQVVKYATELHRVAYMMVRCWVQMLTEHHNELLGQAQSDGETLDVWRRRWFAPVSSCGIDVDCLIHDVTDGLTLADHMAGEKHLRIGKKPAGKRSTKKDRATPIVSAPGPLLTLEEQVTQWRSRCETLEQSWRRRYERLRAQLEDTRAALRKLNRQLAAAVQ
jgi:hypothetical protein